VSSALSFLVDKSTYLPGDTIQITGIGADPQKAAQVELLDNNGYVIINKITSPDSTGSIVYDLQLSRVLAPGNYQVKLISDGDTQTQPVTVVARPNSYTFTAQTDRGVYTAGDTITVSGTATPGTSITGVLSSQSGLTYTAASNANVVGTYTLYFSISTSFESGNWNIDVSNLGQSKRLSIYM